MQIEVGKEKRKLEKHRDCLNLALKIEYAK